MSRAGYLEIRRRSLIESRDVSREGVVDGACPGCKAEPFYIHTHAPEIFKEGLRAGARCRGCKDPVGWFYPLGKRDTLFGAEEDRNVLELGRARVYGGGR